MRPLLRSQLLLTLAAAAAMTACDKRPPAPQPQPQPPGTAETITGRERIGWDQQAGDRVELATFRYAMYVDGARTELAGVTCSNDPGPAGFACSSSLPTLSPGTHTLELASFIVEDIVLESPRSPSLRVNVVAVTRQQQMVQGVSPADAGARGFDASREMTGLKPPSTGSGQAGATGRGSQIPVAQGLSPASLRIDRVADGLREPTDAAFSPDGRLFIAERTGRVSILRDGAVNRDSALTLHDVATGGGNGLLAIAIDPQFDRTRFVYIIYTAASRSGDPVFRLVRFRDVHDTLAERAVLLDAVPAARTRAAASLRFGPDGKLYAAFDAGGDPRRVGDPSSYNGKILRLNGDGTTPIDHPIPTPVYAYGYGTPHGIDWQSGTRALWIAGRDLQDVDRLRLVPQNEVRSIFRAEDTSYVLPRANASAMAFYRGDLMPLLRGDLLVAGGDGPALMRIRFDSANPARIASMEPLVENAGGVVRTLAVSPEGAIYFCVNDEVARLVPGR